MITTMNFHMPLTPLSSALSLPPAMELSLETLLTTALFDHQNMTLITTHKPMLWKVKDSNIQFGRHYVISNQ